ncbi:Cys-tRNA(Pro)/Cys-tRNA(Cys) deacylase YbaK [Grimontia celer]|uniref:Cys-tRNA(Pro)/Cys-tRNA(Cys) deacylase YbaK n=1 Tax=Grimontia celer TaxID=1796497 RepID=A0A128FAH0_9GAMM|nr:YbaK/EbsC family protein [Grimontia celer]CZF83281.1 Cys-tRNA(Pro)/Cys-tRNA(Cys) deacylase YbaK [Grimontia celer]
MENALKPASQRVQTFLSERGKALKVKQMPASTRTASEAAEAIGCTVGQIAKSLIFEDKASGNPVLIVASGTNMVSMDKVKVNAGLDLKKSNADFVREQVGFAIGGVPPIAHKQNVITLLDADLKQFEVIWAAAGTPNSVFELTPQDLDDLTQGRWVEISQ